MRYVLRPARPVSRPIICRMHDKPSQIHRTWGTYFLDFLRGISLQVEVNRESASMQWADDTTTLLDGIQLVFPGRLQVAAENNRSCSPRAC